MSKMISYEKRDPYIKSVFTVATRHRADFRVSNMAHGAVQTFRSRRLPNGEWGTISALASKEYVYLAHYQKVRRKCIHAPKTKLKSGEWERNDYDKSTTFHLRDSHWVVTLYKFPIDRVVSAKQNNRNFRVVLTA